MNYDSIINQWDLNNNKKSDYEISYFIEEVYRKLREAFSNIMKSVLYAGNNDMERCKLCIEKALIIFDECQIFGVSSKGFKDKEEEGKKNIILSLNIKLFNDSMPATSINNFKNSDFIGFLPLLEKSHRIPKKYFINKDDEKKYYDKLVTGYINTNTGNKLVIPDDNMESVYKIYENNLLGLNGNVFLQPPIEHFYTHLTQYNFNPVSSSSYSSLPELSSALSFFNTKLTKDILLNIDDYKNRTSDCVKLTKIVKIFETFKGNNIFNIIKELYFYRSRTRSNSRFVGINKEDKKIHEFVTRIELECDNSVYVGELGENELLKSIEQRNNDPKFPYEYHSLIDYSKRPDFKDRILEYFENNEIEIRKEKCIQLFKDGIKNIVGETEYNSAGKYNYYKEPNLIEIIESSKTKQTTITKPSKIKSKTTKKKSMHKTCNKFDKNKKIFNLNSNLCVRLFSNEWIDCGKVKKNSKGEKYIKSINGTEIKNYRSFRELFEILIDSVYKDIINLGHTKKDIDKELKKVLQDDIKSHGKLIPNNYISKRIRPTTVDTKGNKIRSTKYKIVPIGKC